LIDLGGQSKIDENELLKLYYPQELNQDRQPPTLIESLQPSQEKEDEFSE